MFNLYHTHVIEDDKINRLYDTDTELAYVDSAVPTESYLIDLVAVCKNLQIYIQNTDDVKKEMDAKKKTLEARLEKVKDMLKNLLELMPNHKVKNGIHSATLCATQLKLTITDEKLIPAQYIKTNIVEKIDKQKINDVFKETGEVIAGCEVVERKDLRIS